MGEEAAEGVAPPLAQARKVAAAHQQAHLPRRGEEWKRGAGRLPFALCLWQLAPMAELYVVPGRGLWAVLGAPAPLPEQRSLALQPEQWLMKKL